VVLVGVRRKFLISLPTTVDLSARVLTDGGAEGLPSEWRRVLPRYGGRTSVLLQPFSLLKTNSSLLFLITYSFQRGQKLQFVSQSFYEMVKKLVILWFWFAEHTNDI
jgi:hypothetical protein